jgi:N-acetylglutamate synthase-like GNAT family acetyltransferase
MEIVKATFVDLEYVLPLVIEYYTEDRTDTNLTDEYIIDQTSVMLSSDNCAIVMAVDNESVVGVAALSVSPNYGKLAAQEVFWKVAPSHTKTRVGAQLLKRLEDEAKAMAADTMTVVALTGEHEKRVANSYVSRGYAPVCSTYIKNLG